MADRTPQYPMLPTNFAPSLAGQGASLNQQQQQPQDSSQHSVGGLANPDHSRMWQQMQHQMQQQQHNRATSGVSGDISGSQVNQQMADFLRNQNLVQGQQQQQRPAFGLGPPGGIGVSQPPPFPDMQGNNLGNFTQNNNNPMSQLNPSQLQAAFQQNRNNPMFQALQNQPQVTRQLELMGMAHNQQPQNGPVTLTARLNQQQQPGQQGFHPNMGAGGANAVGGQPGQGNPGGMVPSFNGASAMETRRAALLELRDKAVHLYNGLKLVEQQRVTLANQRAGLSESMFLQRDSVLEQDCAKKREVLTKWNNMLMTNGMHSVGGSVQVNPMGSSSAPQNNMVQQNAHAQPNWMSATQQNNSQPSLGFPTQQMSPNQHFQPSGPSSVQNNTQMPLQAGQGPPRSIPTPQQLISGQGAVNQTSPNSAAQFPTPAQQQNIPGSSLVPALDRNRFYGSYKHFCQTKKVFPDDRRLTIQNRKLDLHRLHFEVMNAGGFQRVTTQDFWPVIGGKLGYIQFPGNDAEPARSSIQVAQHLEQLYKEYLNMFDTIYIASYVQEASRRRQQQAQQQSQSQQQQGLQGQSQQSGTQPRPSMPEQVNPQALIPYAYVPVAELRMRGLPEKAIQWIDERRIALQKAYDHHAQSTRNTNQTGQPGGVPVVQKMQTPQQILSSMPSAAASALANTAVFGNRRPLPNGGQGFPQRTSEAALNLALGISGENNIPQRPAQPASSMNVPMPVGQPKRKPTQDEINRATAFVQRTKQEFMSHGMSSLRLINLPDEQKMEYNLVFENLWRFILDVEPKMSMYSVILSEDLVRKLVNIVLMCHHQRSLLSANPPKFFLDLPTIKMMTSQIQEMFNHHLAMMTGNAPQQQPAPVPQQPPPPGIPAGMQQRIPSQQNTAITIPQAQPVAVSRTPSMSHPVPPTRNANKKSNGDTPASAATPPQSAPTPTSHAAPSVSPSTTSPRTKAKAKVAQRRKTSMKATNANPPTPSPVMEPVSVSTPAAATPASNVVATPSSEASVKRRREEEEGAPVQSAPSPKRVKTEWEGSPSDPLVKRNEEAEKIKTDEEASKFLEGFTELLKQSSGVEGQASMDISDALNQILKPYASGNDFALSMEISEQTGTTSENRNPSPPPSGPIAISDDFGDFFDFSSYAKDDSGSKAPTPDLVVTSSTNPSPESASDPVGTPFNIDMTSGEDSTAMTDLRRLGMWKEIDGGEGAFYQQDNWKWDTPMPTMAQPWAAIFQS